MTVQTHGRPHFYTAAFPQDGDHLPSGLWGGLAGPLMLQDFRLSFPNFPLSAYSVPGILQLGIILED